MSAGNTLISQSPAASTQPDVFIAGAGPAGLACAIAAARQGLTVQVADGMSPPIDKACGEGLLPGTIAALIHLGIDLQAVPPAACAALRGIRFLTTDRAGAAVSTQANFPAGHGLGMKRPLLHHLLVERATTLGVRFLWQTVVAGINFGRNERAQVTTSRQTIHPRFIVGADGHQSRIRAWAGLDRASISARRIGLRQHFTVDPRSTPLDHVEVHWGDCGQAYVTPISPGEICVALVARKKSPSVADALALYPQLQNRLRTATLSGSPRGAVTLSRRLHRVTRSNIALIGDASGSVDAVTGEGLGLCFRQALELGTALKAGDLAPYQHAHTHLSRLPSFMARIMLLLDSSPPLRNQALRALERRPQLFAQMLSVHIGHDPIRLFGPTGLLAAGALLLAG